MISKSDYQLVVRFRDANVETRVLVDQEHIIDREDGQYKYQVDYFIPNLWDGVPRSAQIKGVSFSVKGRRFELPLSPVDVDRSHDKSLTMRFHISYDPDESPTDVAFITESSTPPRQDHAPG